MAADGWFIYNGRDGALIPPGVTRVRIHESVSVIPAEAFQGNRNIKEVDFHYRVKTVEDYAFRWCPSLIRAIMPGVEVVENEAFCGCEALAIVECDKLEIIRHHAFSGCESLKSIDLPSAKIIGGTVFNYCTALTDVKFGKELESIGWCAFRVCTSLERIIIPLKDGMITENDTFQDCENLKHVDLVKGELHETTAALLLEEWKNDVNEEINSINQILSNAPAGDDVDNVGGKARAIRRWIRSVLRKIIHYKAQHFSVLEEAAARLKLTLPQDIVIKNVLPFLELPSYTFEVGDHEDEEDDSEEEEEGDDESSY
eukprot:scaffold6480_cov84-Skeletonema_dohrnii-CCMP3373.AAC.2